MSSKAKYIIDLLGKGYTPKATAKLLDVSPSLVSQVAAENLDAIEDKKSDVQMLSLAKDQELDEIEDMLLQKVRALAALESDSMKVLRMWEAISKAPRVSRKVDQPLVDSKNTNIVQLVLSETAQQKVEYVVNPQNDVVEVNGRTMVTASSKQAVDMMHNMLKSKKQEAFDDILESASSIEQGTAISGGQDNVESDRKTS